ncbi:MAG: alpha/beta hydrolase [Maritimibacter sp.]
MLRFVSVFVLLGLAALIASGAAERAALYPFDPRRTDPPAGISASTLTTEDGETLVVWSAKPAPGQPVVLYFHGNAGNLGNRIGRFKAFRARGFGLVAAGYRGSSGSTGSPTEEVLSRDALALAEAVPGLVGKAPVVYYGESLGSAVAIALAVKRPPAALVLEAPFSSLATMSEALFGSPSLARLVKSRWPSAARIAKVEAPLLVLHGSNDQLVPPEQGRAVYAAAGSDDKRFYSVPGAGHETVWQVEAQRVLYRFLNRF